jgi:hypothetical protein
MYRRSCRTIATPAGLPPCACGRSSPVGDTPADDNAIRVLSNRVDLISGGDALVEVDLGDATPEDVRVTLNGAKRAHQLMIKQYPNPAN